MCRKQPIVPVLRSAAIAIAILALAVPAAQATMPSPVLVVGDSLAVGMKPYLGDQLGSSEVVWDARSGRTTPEGLVHLRARLRAVTPQTVVIRKPEIAKKTSTPTNPPGIACGHRWKSTTSSTAIARSAWISSRLECPADTR